MTTSAMATSIARIAPGGELITLSIPDEFGTHRWYASTKFASQRGVRQFTVAPVGQYQVIPRKILRNAQKTTWQRRGHDVVLFEAVDRSNSCLVFVGPHHEATTWFGGPAPDKRGLNTLLSMVEFVDGAKGAILKPRLSQYVRTFGTSVIGCGTDSLLMIRSANDGLSSLPDWSGQQLVHGELWRTSLALPKEQAARVAGTHHEWRYIWANPNCVVDVVMNPRGEIPSVPSADSWDLVSAFNRFHASWMMRKDQRA